MVKFVTDNEYLKLLNCDDIPDNFNILVIEASNYINLHTFGRIDIDNIPEQVKYVTCLIIDLINKAEIQEKESSGLKSQNIEGWSETYSTPEEIKNKLELDKQDILNKYLFNIKGKDGKELLYRGL